MRETSAERKKRIRRKLLRDQKYKCCYCGITLRQSGPNCGNKATIEHVLPKALGGTLKRENIKAACWTCNNQRGMLLAEQLRHFRRKAEAELQQVGRGTRGEAEVIAAGTGRPTDHSMRRPD